MEIVVHVGMHKTGSSAIQNYFGRNSIEGLGYLPWNGPNHCGLFILLFQDEDKVSDYHGFRALGPDFIRSIPALRAEWLEKTSKYISSFDGKKILFSAEDISWPGFASAAQKMVNFFRSFSDDVTGIGYVREARSFSVSAYQQYLQGADVYKLNLDHLWPSYRGRFEHLDEIFGENRLTLKIYDRNNLHDNNVVSDFANHLGYSVGKVVDADSNASLSAEATALLYIQRALGSGFGNAEPNAFAKNARFISSISGIGTQQFDFSDEIWSETEAKYRDDLLWIESRLGKKFSDMDGKGRIKITDEEDLCDLGMANVVALKQQLCNAIFSVQVADVKDLARLTNLLKLLV